MKKIYTLIIFYSLISGVSLNAQAPQKNKNPNPANTVHTLHGVEQDTCLNKKFSVVFYLIQDSAGLKSFAPIQNTRINLMINLLNSTFSRICVSFESCSLVVIPNYEFNSWYKQTDVAVTDNWYTEKTINVYLVEKLEEMPAEERAGYAHAPFVPGAMNTTKDVIVLQYITPPGYKKDHAFSNNEAGFTASTVLHVMGHFFGLPDTHSELQSPVPFGTNEEVRRTNCATAGDGFCDTEADPFPISNFPPDIVRPIGTYCDYYPNVKDAKGDYYTPPVDNIMSMYGCRCRFTRQQYNYMARYILKNRMYLH